MDGMWEERQETNYMISIMNNEFNPTISLDLWITIMSLLIAITTVKYENYPI